ncbi:MAG TPA: RpiB/LacA/LacB family sugar-phosphate isomerase [Hanamia sp.]|nr:RpiB/LacA/LacB family sugar-phosphate isomerase [Hanamia sp.]
MKIGIACDHGGFDLKNTLHIYLKENNYDVKDYGAYELNKADDYPDFVVPLARAVALKEVDRGIAICGSGVGASVAANKVPGVRSALIHDHFSAHQGVEDDDMNLLCLGGRVTAYAAAEELVSAFLNAKYVGNERFKRRLEKVAALETKNI